MQELFVCWSLLIYVHLMTLWFDTDKCKVLICDFFFLKKCQEIVKRSNF